jgi:Protein of unknown function (DUF1579)
VDRVFRAACIASLALSCLQGAASDAPVAIALSGSPDGARSTVAAEHHTFIRQMVGTWDVRTRIWTGPGVAPVRLPPATARRRLIGDTLLEEVMTPASRSVQDPFVRMAYFSYNRVNQRYEWLSMDTRAPQMMYERSLNGHEKNAVSLYLDSFVLPQWGKATYAAFRQRRVFEFELNRQVVRQYWTPLSGEDSVEFLAVEYVYVRQR